MINRVRVTPLRIAAWVSSRGREDGASMVEYAMLVGLIAMVAFIAVLILGQVLSDEYDTIQDSVANFGR